MYPSAASTTNPSVILTEPLTHRSNVSAPLNPITLVDRLDRDGDYESHKRAIGTRKRAASPLLSPLVKESMPVH
jgi:hypothetical protein